MIYIWQRMLGEYQRFLELTVTSQSTSKMGKKGEKVFLKNAWWVHESVWRKYLSVCMWMHQSVENFLYPFLYPHDFLSLLCVAINPPQNPPNILEAQKSFFFHASYCLHLPSRSISLELFITLCHRFPCPIPLFLITPASCAGSSREMFIIASYTPLLNGPEIESDR